MNCPYIRISENNNYKVHYFENFYLENADENLCASDYVYDAMKLLFLKLCSDEKISKETAEESIKKIEDIRIQIRRNFECSEELNEHFANELKQLAGILNEHR